MARAARDERRVRVRVVGLREHVHAGLRPALNPPFTALHRAARGTRDGVFENSLELSKPGRHQARPPRRYRSTFLSCVAAKMAANVPNERTSVARTSRSPLAIRTGRVGRASLFAGPAITRTPRSSQHSADHRSRFLQQKAPSQAAVNLGRARCTRRSTDPSHSDVCAHAHRDDVGLSVGDIREARARASRVPPPWVRAARSRDRVAPPPHRPTDVTRVAR